MSNRKKLLLADDSVTIQKVVNLTFADEGIEVLAVGDGDAAMEKFVEFAPDLLMLDVNMPGADGYRICEMIKQDEETAHIPVILLVGSFEPFDEDEARRVGADDFLTKPFQSIRQLVGKVTALLDSGYVSAAANKDVSVGAAFSSPAIESAETFQTDDAEFSGAIYADDNKEAAHDAPQFGDAETFDDETIQTNQIGSLPVDETQRFSANFVAENDEDDSQISIAAPSENLYAYETETIENDWEMPPVSDAEKSGDASLIENEESAKPDGNLDETPDENDYEQANEQNLSNESGDDLENYSDDKGISLNSAPAQNFSWDFDEMNLLELPFDKDESIDNQAENKPETFQSNEPEPQETAAAPIAPPPQMNISPELIEQIASRVAEKLSDRVIGAITREFVPQMSDLIAQELARENSEE